MQYDPANPLIVQGDRTVLVEVDNPRYAEARDALAPFAELEKSPEHIHTYRLTNLSLWNAAAAGMSAAQMVDVLARFSKFPLPGNLPIDLAETVSRYGRVQAAQGRRSAAAGVCGSAAAGRVGPAAQTARVTWANGSMSRASRWTPPFAACSSRR